MSVLLKKNGKNQVWNNRLKCNACWYCFVERRIQKQEYWFRTRSWFEKYIIEWYSARQIADQSGKKEYIVRADIQTRLDSNQLHHIDEYYEQAQYIMIDGYHLPGGKILLVYYEYILTKVLWFSIADSESRQAIAYDLRFLRDSFWYAFTAFTIDGSPSILSAIKSVYPNSIVQRCIVHVQRQVLTYTTRHPKSEAWKDLLRILCYPILSDPNIFLLKFDQWKTKHYSFLTERSVSSKGRRIFTHTSLRKAMKHIDNALLHMYQSYQYNDFQIERSTNKLEWYFWVFTNEWINEHKGLSTKRLYSFVALWIYFRNNR